MENKNLGLKKEILIIAIIALLALSLAVGITLIGRKDEKIAVIKQGGSEIYRIDLQSVKEAYEIEITDGCEMHIDVECGRIRVASSSCPDKICVDCGWLSESGDSAVCLPNKVSVHIE